MKNKTLLTILAALCALLIFETGYLIGIGEQRRLFRELANRYLYPPQRTFYPNWNMSPAPKQEWPVWTKKKSFFVAAMTSKDTDQAKIITVSLAGVDKKDIRIEVRGRYLTVQAGKRREARTNKDNFYAEELSSSNFVQTIALGDNADTQQIRAGFNNGVLTITVPKDKQPGKTSEQVFTVPVK